MMLIGLLNCRIVEMRPESNRGFFPQSKSFRRLCLHVERDAYQMRTSPLAGDKILIFHFGNLIVSRKLDSSGIKHVQREARLVDLTFDVGTRAWKVSS